MLLDYPYRPITVCIYLFGITLFSYWYSQDSVFSAPQVISSVVKLWILIVLTYCESALLYCDRLTSIYQLYYSTRQSRSITQSLYAKLEVWTETIEEKYLEEGLLAQSIPDNQKSLADLLLDAGVYKLGPPDTSRYIPILCCITWENIRSFFLCVSCNCSLCLNVFSLIEEALNKSHITTWFNNRHRDLASNRETLISFIDYKLIQLFRATITVKHIKEKSEKLPIFDSVGFTGITLDNLKFTLFLIYLFLLAALIYLIYRFELSIDNVKSITTGTER
jgi:hypothetical protein